jgi:hypothetical protein
MMEVDSEVTCAAGDEVNFGSWGKALGVHFFLLVCSQSVEDCSAISPEVVFTAIIAKVDRK